MVAYLQPFALLDIINDIADIATATRTVDAHHSGERQREHKRVRKTVAAGSTGKVAPVSDFGSFSPSLDGYDNEHEVTIVANVPGVTKENLLIDFDPQSFELLISGEVKHPEEYQSEEALRTRRISELPHGRFERRFDVSSIVAGTKASFQASNVTAKLENGVLTIKIPKFNMGLKHRITVS